MIQKNHMPWLEFRNMFYIADKVEENNLASKNAAVSK